MPRERVSLFGAVLLWTMRCGKSCEALAQSLALSVLCSDIGLAGSVSISGAYVCSFGEGRIEKFSRNLFCCGALNFTLPGASKTAMSLPVTVTVKGKKYAGEYQIEGSLLRVFFDGKSKTTSANSANPEFVARLLLIELVCRVYRSSPF